MFNKLIFPAFIILCATKSVFAEEDEFLDLRVEGYEAYSSIFKLLCKNYTLDDSVIRNMKIECMFGQSEPQDWNVS